MSSETKILQFIDIPKFSNDLRLVILDYMYFRDVTKISNNNIPYWLRLGLHLEDDHLFFRITCHHPGFNRVLSSFGIYCEEKAIVEYNNLKNNICEKICFHWENIFTSCDDSDYQRLYTYCFTNQSTIVIEAQEKTIRYMGGRQAKLYDLRLCTIADAVFTQRDGDFLKTSYRWNYREGYIQHNSLESVRRNMRLYQQNAILHGVEWAENHSGWNAGCIQPGASRSRDDVVSTEYPIYSTEEEEDDIISTEKVENMDLC